MNALLIARANVTRMFRDRIGLVFTFIVPVVIIVVMGMAFGGQGVRHVGIADVDASPLSAELIASIDRTRGPIELRTFGTAESLRDAVQRNTVDIGLVIPAGYEAAIREGGTGQVEYVGRPETITSAIRPLLDDAVHAEAALFKAARYAADQRGIGFDEVRRRPGPRTGDRHRRGDRQHDRRADHRGRDERLHHGRRASWSSGCLSRR